MPSLQLKYEFGTFSLLLHKRLQLDEQTIIQSCESSPESESRKNIFYVRVLEDSDGFYYLLPFHVDCRKKKIKQLFVFY